MTAEFCWGQSIYGIWEINEDEEAPAFFGEEPFSIVSLQPDGTIMFALYHDVEDGFACPTEGKSKIKEYHITGKVDHACLLRKVPKKFHFLYTFHPERDEFSVYVDDEGYHFHRFSGTGGLGE